MKCCTLMQKKQSSFGFANSAHMPSVAKVQCKGRRGDRPGKMEKVRHCAARLLHRASRPPVSRRWLPQDNRPNVPIGKSQNPNLDVKIANIFQSTADEQDPARMLGEPPGWERMCFYFGKSAPEMCFLTSRGEGGSSWAHIPGQGSSLHREVSCICGTKNPKLTRGARL